MSQERPLFLPSRHLLLPIKLGGSKAEISPDRSTSYAISRWIATGVLFKMRARAFVSNKSPTDDSRGLHLA